MPSANDPYLITRAQADGYLAGRIRDAGSLTRAAIDAILPKGGSAVAYGAQFVKQAPSGSWPNPVRDSSTGGRIFLGSDASRPPAYADGLVSGDVWVSPAGVRVANVVPTMGAASWTVVTTGTGTTTDPGTTTPTTPGDNSSPSPTSRPYALLGSTGVWSTTTGVSLIQALSDQAASGAVATPTGGNGGVSLILDMSNFAHTDGNDLTVTLWGAASKEPGDVQAAIGAGGKVYAAEKTAKVTTTAGNVTFTWSQADQAALPSASWRDVELTIARPLGGFSSLADITLQSAPPTTPTSPGTDPSVASALLWAPGSVWYSDCSSAPTAKASAAIAAYVKAQATSGALRLDVYADAAPIWMAPSNTPRVNVTPPASSTRGDVALMHTSDGKGALDGVPIPAAAATPANTFGTMIVASVDTKQVWELLGAVKTGSTWSAQWGGRLDNYTATGGAFPAGTGFTGSGLAFAAAALKITEARAAAGGNSKAIGHALGLNLNYDSAASTYCWPATRSDGTSSDAGAPRMGQRLRLKASADLSGCTPIGRAVGEAMKRYGIVVMGGADKISVLAESGATEQASTGVDPWGTLLAGRTVDTVLAGIPLDQLEAVSPGWGSPSWVAETDPITTNPTNPGTGTTTPTNPGGSNPWGYRRPIYIQEGQLWNSGASCFAIEFSAEGMASQFAQWRGEPAYMARTWWDTSDPQNTLWTHWKTWNASIDVGPGYFLRGGSLDAAASGAYDDRWRAELKATRTWWTGRRDPSKCTVYVSPAHEMTGTWYPWSVTKANSAKFIASWKRYRGIQLQEFPEGVLTFNPNRDSQGPFGQDWRHIVPGYDEGGAAEVRKWVDCGAVDYYNQSGNQVVDSLSEWEDRITWKDKWGGPLGLNEHRKFWESMGLPMTIPEWGNNAADGDHPAYADGMNQYLRKYAGNGPGKIPAEAYFNLTQGFPSGKFAMVGDEVGSPRFAARYRELVWGK